MATVAFPKHDDGTIDRRYRVNKGHYGYSILMLGVYFCDELIGVTIDPAKASHIMQTHKKSMWDEIK